MNNFRAGGYLFSGINGSLVYFDDTLMAQWCQYCEFPAYIFTYVQIMCVRLIGLTGKVRD